MTATSITIDVAELREMLESGKPVTVLDVRPASERAEWSIPGSIHVDAYSALRAGNPDALAGARLTGGQPVVTICAAGQTSLIAALQLRSRGVDARSLSGGMRAWSLSWNSAEVDVCSRDAKVIQVRRTGKGCLSYLIGSSGEAAVIDAALDPQAYIDLARAHGWTIRHVLDTHVHADHLSRSRALAEATGATLYLPWQDRVAYPFQPLDEGDVVPIGEIELRAIHTPGHTPESTTYLIVGQAMFTGDTLFADGVGRPDLEADPEQARARAHMLYRSLRQLTALPPSMVVLPGHTGEPVPFDGRPVQAELRDVIDRVDLLREPEETFVAMILDRLPPTPPNHGLIVRLNEAGLLPGPEDQSGLEAGANRCAVS
jgi:glyoxylase-like metal-dependent hydrolase (beta-lactamase superfamily II)/rhodanese-related sulfurtransferase